MIQCGHLYPLFVAKKTFVSSAKTSLEFDTLVVIVVIFLDGGKGVGWKQRQQGGCMTCH